MPATFRPSMYAPRAAMLLEKQGDSRTINRPAFSCAYFPSRPPSVMMKASRGEHPKRPIIWRYFLPGTRRFGELKRSLSGVSQKVLTAQLRQMEDSGLLTRTGRWRRAATGTCTAPTGRLWPRWRNTGENLFSGHAAGVDTARPGFVFPDHRQTALFIPAGGGGLLGMDRHVDLREAPAGEAYESIHYKKHALACFFVLIST